MRISDWSSDVCSSDLQSTAVVACGSDPNANARRAGHRNHPPYQHHRPKDAAELLETWCEIRDLDGASAVIVERRYHRSEERRVGKECVRTCRSRWSP